VTRFVAPDGPGVRVDSGVETGTVIGGQFDSMVGKLIVTGEDREQAIARSRRALAELVVEGLPTVIPFHRVVLEDPAFTAPEGAESFVVHTRWIETEFDNQIEPFQAAEPAEDDEESAPRQTVVVEVGGKRLEVSLPGDLAIGGGGGGGRGAAPKKKRKRSGGGAKVSGDAVTAPMQGTVVKVAVSEGDTVAAGDLVVVVEAMKMENPVTAHKDGVVTGLTLEAGASVNQGAVICEIPDAG
jgi:acetyl-CoA/propionyl-CoA carboxylase, biotin carboxylase, biotin carboxyl carrier protein